ncbi:hypothetical protein EV715DRAFT_209601 [Schizophyllum commune]
MKLAAFGVQTLFYGVYLTLTALIVYLEYRLPSPHAAASKARSAIFNWYADVLFALVVTAHWITSFVRIFEGFVSWRGGMDATVYFSDTTDRILFALSIFKFATMIIADVFMIWRLYCAWEKRKSVLIVPAITLSGLLVTSVGGMCNVQLLPHNPQFLHLVPDERRAIQAWKTANTACAICTNVYCTATIVFRLWSMRRRSPQVLGASLSGVIIAFVEGAAFPRSHRSHSPAPLCLVAQSAPQLTPHLPSLAVVLLQITYALGHPARYLFVDCAPEAAALSMALICVRPVIVRYGAGAKCGGGAAADVERGGAILASRRAPSILSAGPTATSHLDSGAFKAYSKDRFEASDGSVERATKAESTSGVSDMTLEPEEAMAGDRVTSGLWREGNR